MSIISRILYLYQNCTSDQRRNFLLNEFEFRFQRHRLISKPKVLDIVVANKCILDCVFCRFRDLNKNCFLSVQDYGDIARLFFNTAIEVRFCSGGEAYLHPHLIALLRLTKGYRVPVTLLSNGMLLTTSSIKTMVDEKLVKNHNFSYDGYKDSTVSRIRRGIDPNLVKKNISSFLQYKQTSRTDIKTAIRYTIMQSNLHELPDAITFWGNAGIDQIECSYLSIAHETSITDSVFFSETEVRRVFEQCIKSSLAFPKMELNLPRLVSDYKTNQKCKNPWSFLSIDSDGQAYPCYYAWPGYPLGNLTNASDQELMRIWNSSRLQELRRNCNKQNCADSGYQCNSCCRRVGYGKLENHNLLGCGDRWPSHCTDKSPALAA